MSLNRTKTDPQLGLEIHKHLLACGVETPGVGTMQPRTSSGRVFTDRKTQIEYIENKIADVLMALGLDLTDDSLIETPKRVAKMYVGEIFFGLEIEAFPKCTAVQNKMHYDEMVVERNVNVKSNCEHHLIVIDGFATVAYIPKAKVLGLSKLNRVVEYFAKRPQIQERLTSQIYHALQYILETDDVAVVIDARHFCVAARGIEDTGSTTITSKLGGCFKDDLATRAEFMSIATSR